MNDVALYDHIGCPAGQNTILVPFTAQKPTRFPSYPSLHPLYLSSLNSHCPHYHALSLSLFLPLTLPAYPWLPSPSVTSSTPSLSQRLCSLPVELATTLLSTIPPHPLSLSFSLATTLLCPSLRCHISHNLGSPRPLSFLLDCAYHRSFDSFYKMDHVCAPLPSLLPCISCAEKIFNEI
jgi:hypothetical protein